MQCSPMVLMYERPGYYSNILFHIIKTELCHIPVLVKHSNITNACSVVDLMHKKLQADPDF